MRHQPCAQRVAMHIEHQSLKIGFPLNQKCLESTLKEMADSLVTGIVPDRIRDLEPMHRSREVRLAGVNDQMKVIAPQDISMNVQSKSLAALRQALEERPAIGGITKDVAPFVASVQDVVKRVSLVYPQRPRHRLHRIAWKSACQEFN
jgi:hypothetical protein